MKTAQQKNKAKTIRRIALIVLLILVAGFVVYNLYASRDIETVEQTTVTPGENTADTPDTDSVAPVVRSGTFQSLNGYSVSGDVELIVNGDQRRLVFSDSFAASIGPDVLVYLTKNDTAAEGGSIDDPISLGPLQSFGGAQTYTLPADSDEYSSVVIWCRAFSVAFGAASV